MKTGIYGGTFNPPHRGHVNAARDAASFLGLDRILIIPTGDPPHKELPDDTPDAKSRFEMAKLVFSELPCAEMCDIEINRTGESYTSDTVRELKALYPDDEFYLIVGTDMLKTLYRWHEAEYIVKNAVPVCKSRCENDGPDISDAASKLREMYGTEPVIIPGEVMEMSSTDIREALENRHGREFTGDDLYGYILKNRFYNVKTDFDYLRERAYRWLKLKRIPHVAGCEAEAVNLARRWGADADMAREAAILHDITKKYEQDDQLLLCEKYGIITDDTEKREYKLLHSKTGAAASKAEFGVCDEVFDAITWHTTGRSNMTLLEKIIYMADYIEPTRDFEGLAELRRLAYTDIDRAMEMGLRMSIDEMRQRGIEPHGRSLEAAEWLASHRR